MINKLLKALLVLVLFALCYGGVMVFAYDFFYEYPIGILDTMERADEARYYKLVYSNKIDKNTMLYFTRSNNGVGKGIHFGTLDSKYPNMIANFFCESTSSVYCDTETICYVTATSSDRTSYLFGVTSDENTVDIEVTFYIAEDETQTFELEFEDHCYYLRDFDPKYAQYRSDITGYNADGYATFIRYCSPMEEPGKPAEVY